MKIITIIAGAIGCVVVGIVIGVLILNAALKEGFRR